MTFKEKIQTYKVVSLGCRTNHYEAQAYKEQLKALGIREVQDQAECDLCIVNTCTVTASADSHSRHQIRQLNRQHPKAQIWVTGCLAQRDPEGIRAIKGVTAVVNNLDKETLLNCIFPYKTIPEFKIQEFNEQTRAFIKVQDGCNSFCSYCVIPYVRGRSRSRNLQDVLREAQELVANGYKEIVLTGINIGDFDGGGEDQEGRPLATLADLVRAIDNVPGLKRLRLSSIDPDEVDENLMHAVLEGKHTCPSLHIVLQSGSNFVLKRMRRKYTRQIFLDSCQKLLSQRPDFTFTTDIIVGFPGESETDFQQTLDMVQQIRFAKVHMFPYSKRPMTRAARYTDELAPQVINQRKRILTELSEKVAFELRNQYIGKYIHVLTEGKSNNGMIGGHSDQFFYVHVHNPQGKIAPNEYICVRITENHPEGLVGEFIEYV